MGMLVHSDLRECSTKKFAHWEFRISNFQLIQEYKMKHTLVCFILQHGNMLQFETYIPCHVETKFKGVTKIIDLHCFIYSLSALQEGVYFTANIPFNITKEIVFCLRVCAPCVNLVIKSAPLEQDIWVRILTFTGHTIGVLKVIILCHKHKISIFDYPLR